MSHGSFDFILSNRGIAFSFTCVAVRKAPNRSNHLRNCFSVLRVPCSYYKMLTTSLACSGFTYGRCLGNFNIHVTRSLLLHNKRSMASRSIVRGVNLPYFVGPDLKNSDFNIAGIATGRRVRPTVTGTFTRTRRMLIRTFVSKARVAYNYCGAGSGSMIFPVARIIDRGRCFSCRTGCGNTSSRVAPTHVSSSLAHQIRALASTVCSVLKTCNVVHISCVVARKRGVGLLRIGAAPKVATADFVPRRIHTTKVRVGSMVASVVRGGFGSWSLFVVGTGIRFSRVHPCRSRRLPRICRRLVTSTTFQRTISAIVPNMPFRI